MIDALTLWPWWLQMVVLTPVGVGGCLVGILGADYARENWGWGRK